MFHALLTFFYSESAIAVYCRRLNKLDNIDFYSADSYGHLAR